MTEYELANAVVTALCDRKQKVSTAESCTGGLLSALITSISGSSNVFEYGIIAYANCIKEAKLGVLHTSLERFGAVSEQVATEMARGVRLEGGADYGVSITGVAGPTGGSEQKPVGTVYIAVSSKEKSLCRRLDIGEECGFEREKIRRLTVIKALLLLQDAICE